MRRSGGFRGLIVLATALWWGVPLLLLLLLLDELLLFDKVHGFQINVPIFQPPPPRHRVPPRSLPLAGKSASPTQRNGIHAGSSSSSSTALPNSFFNIIDLDQVESFLLGGLFPSDDGDSANKNGLADKDRILGTFCLEESNTIADLVAAQRSVTHFLTMFAKQLQEEANGSSSISSSSSSGLATPVVASDFTPYNEPSTINGVSTKPTKRILKLVQPEDTSSLSMDDDDSSANANTLPPPVCMKLTFKPPKRYLSYKEQKSMEKGVIPDRKGAKVDAWSPGGVALIVKASCLSKASGGGNNDNNSNSHENSKSMQQQHFQLELVAQRCDIDDDTIVKERSERAILRRLSEAIRIWTKVRAMS